ncbi:MAG: IclR family transcriptional regulator [Rhizomicrobium sp.]
MDQTLARGMALLEILSAADRPLGVSDLARQARTTKSSTHRYLQTLVQLGYAANREGQYAATLRVWHLGSRVIERLDLRRVVRPIMDRLAQSTLETVHLAIFDGLEICYIDKAEGVHSIRAYAEIGGRAPAHCVSAGKIFMAFHPPALAAVLEAPRRRFTQRTMTDKAAIRREATAVRQRGIAVNRGEWEPDVCGISAPIWNADGQLAAAIGLTLPSLRFTAASRQRLSDSVRHAAREASHALGAPSEQQADVA